MSANDTPTPFTDEDIRKILKSVDTNYELPEWQRNIRGLVARLEAAEKVSRNVELLHDLTKCCGTCSTRLYVSEWHRISGKKQ